MATLVAWPQKVSLDILLAFKDCCPFHSIEQSLIFFQMNIMKLNVVWQRTISCDLEQPDGEVMFDDGTVLCVLSGSRDSFSLAIVIWYPQIVSERRQYKCSLIDDDQALFRHIDVHRKLDKC